MKLQNLIPRWLNKRIPYKGSIHRNPSKTFRRVLVAIEDMDRNIASAFDYANQGNNHEDCNWKEHHYGNARQGFVLAHRSLLYLHTPPLSQDIMKEKYENIISVVSGYLIEKELELAITFPNTAEVGRNKVR